MWCSISYVPEASCVGRLGEIGLLSYFKAFFHTGVVYHISHQLNIAVSDFDSRVSPQHKDINDVCW